MKRIDISAYFMVFIAVLSGIGSAQPIPATPAPVIDEVTDEVRWNAWSNSTFDGAQAENKPVFVSIEARWQYASQALRLDAYQDSAIAGFINANFIPVRVDADQRPDIVRRYSSEGLPKVLILSPSGLILQDPKSGDPYQLLQPESAEIPILCQKVIQQLQRENTLYQLTPKLEKQPPLLKAEKNVFSDDFVRQILVNIDKQYDAEQGGFGDPDKFYQPKRPEVDALRLHLVASQLWGEKNLLVPISVTLERMYRSRNFYQKGFGEQAEYRNWVRSNTEKTLKTNMALLELYLRMHRETGEDRYMEPVYSLIEDSESFQDIFLRKGFGGAFYSAQRAMIRTDYERGLSEGPMLQTLITPWVEQAIYSTYLVGQVTQDTKWGRKASKATDFMMTEMVHANGRVAYSLDRTAPGVDTIFAAHPAMAKALLESWQCTSRSEYLKEAERVMEMAVNDFWLAKQDYFSDVLPSPNQVGLLKHPRVDLDANAQAVEVFITLAEATGKEDYRARASKILVALAGEAEKNPMKAATFGIAALKYSHSLVKATVVGAAADAQTRALRDAALELNFPNLLVEVVDPERQVDRLEELKLEGGLQPSLFLSREDAKKGPITDPTKVSVALSELLKEKE